jgi:hypothetical protein
MQPPDGSKIRIEPTALGTRVEIPHQRPGIGSYLVGGFLAFWLLGWFTGLVMVTGVMFTEKPGAHSLFLVFWLGAWLVGGLMVGTIVYRTFRPPVPESWLLRRDQLVYDSGIAPLRQPGPGFGARPNYLKNIFGRRTRITFPFRELEGLALREGDSRNRLTIDARLKRIDLAPGVSDVEREWLYRLLLDEYRLAPPEA